MAIDPTRVRRYAHGSRVPGWDDAADLDEGAGRRARPGDDAGARRAARGDRGLHEPLPGLPLRGDPGAARRAAAARLVLADRDRAGRVRDAADARLPDRGRDVLRHVRDAAQGPRRRLRLHEHLLLAARRRPLYEAMLDAAGNDPDFHVQVVRVPRRVRHRADGLVDGEYVGPLVEADCAQIVEDVKAGRPVLEAKQLPRTAKAGRATLTTWQLLFDNIDQPGLNTLDGLPRERGGYEMLAQGARHGAGRRARRAAGVRHPRPRRRRLRDGHEGVVPPQGRHGQVRRLQRGRVRAGDVQGPRADAEEPAPADRGHLHRRARGRREQGVHLHPRRVRPTRPTILEEALAEAKAANAARRRSTCGSTAAPAPTSAARRPRCSTRSRASAATRA